MSIKFKRLNPDAKLPAKGYSTDTGWDVTAISCQMSEDGRYVEYGTGLAVQLPLGYGFQVRPRSSISKYDLILCNAPGTIDNEYRGEIKLRFRLLKDASKIYLIGDKIGQLVLEKVLESHLEWAEELTESMRKENGFGSTGN
jgi:dUTP pyrophosphatase